eukprot:TRINITY_DN23358_c0_g1_i1.p1 TRINITY_DN23358_c0_g1~~TRINITY_DN23358_c0_g1_i1.p1  ORF type:complete len:226 (-),score=45.29 TRINITY_DN23358_c0_g1_i1:47-724(-)
MKGATLFVLSALLLVSVALAAVPGNIINLKPFALQIPYAPNEIYQPTLETYSRPPYFYASGDHVVFLAYVNGSHTSGSEFPRTELSERARWSSHGEVSRLIVKHAYTHLPEKRKEIVGAQILATGGPVCQVRLNYPNIVVYGAAGNKVIRRDYELGTVITTEIEVQNNKITISLDGKVAMSWSHVGQGMYFKAGAYVQSNLRYDDKEQYGAVSMYSVSVSHQQVE